MNERKLTKKELDFCRIYVRLRNPKESAIRAGFEILPEYRAISLLSKKEIRQKIAELENLTASEDDINAEYARIAEAYGIDVEQVKASIDSEFIAADMRVKLALDAVKEKAVVKAPKKKSTRKAAPKAEAAEGEEKPAKKTTRKTTKKATEETTEA